MHKLAVVWCLVILAGVSAAALVDKPVLGHFSAMSPGEPLADGWNVTLLKDIKPNRFQLEEVDGTTVLRIDSAASGASVSRLVDIDPDTNPHLRWRWRVSNVVEKGNLNTKEGDDFAARLYVMFEISTEALSFYERTKLKIARLIYGDQVPAAALCYVWGNDSVDIGDTAWNPYTSRVRMIVLRNAASGVGRWVTEKRNIAADFRDAFGVAPASISGLALAADTDQTGESATSWFGDIEIVEE